MALTDSLSLHLNLADNAASTTVVAQVGTNATLAGGDNTSVKHAAGPNTAIPDAFDMNGSDDQIDISGSSLSFASGAAFSVRALCKFDASAGYIMGVTAGGGGSSFYNGNGTIVVYIATNQYTVSALGTTLWRDMVLTKGTDNAVRVYTDGTASASNPKTITTTFAPTRLCNVSGNFYDGKIASVSVWSRELSAAEVTELYNGGSWLAYPWVPLRRITNQFRQRWA